MFKEAILLGTGIAIGFWLRGASNERKRLKEENTLLMAKLREQEAAKKGDA
ncbi:hypothetical protein D3C73_209840 [compost metagenome]|jgi:hypothetical protein